MQGATTGCVGDEDCCGVLFDELDGRGDRVEPVPDWNDFFAL